MFYDIHYYCVEFDDGYSIAIKGIMMPTREEAESFLANDIAQLDLGKVTDVYMIDEQEVYVGYDTTYIDKWPVFGMTGRCGKCNHKKAL